MKSRRRALLLGFTLLAFGAGLVRASRRPAPSRFRVAPAGEVSRRESGPAGRPRKASRFVSKRHDLNAHVASLVELGDGRLRAFWFSGSREGARDVRILSAVFDPRSETWSEPRPAAGPESSERALHRRVAKVGNPTALRTPEGELWLFYVTVTVGGWGGSSVSVVRSQDEGESWGPARRLIGSPFLNLNTMVRGAPFLYEDGSIGLPAYQSLVGGFSEILRIDASGAVVDKQRLSTLEAGSQPVVVPTDPDSALALMRPSGRQPPGPVLLSRTRDAGRRWSLPSRTSLRNPDAGLGGVALPRRGVLLALNDVDVERDALSLVACDEAGTAFHSVFRLEDQLAARSLPVDDQRYDRTVAALARATDAGVGDGARYVASSRRFMCWEPRCHFEFSYPSLIRSRSGEYHLVYTWNRAYIKHVQFNQAWLDERLPGAAVAPFH